MIKHSGLTGDKFQNLKESVGEFTYVYLQVIQSYNHEEVSHLLYNDSHTSVHQRFMSGEHNYAHPPPPPVHLHCKSF